MRKHRAWKLRLYINTDPIWSTRLGRYFGLRFVIGLDCGPADNRYIGAGYIDGWTAYFAWKSNSRQWAWDFRNGSKGHSRKGRLPRRHSRFPLEMGITRNGNAVPYV